MVSSKHDYIRTIVSVKHDYVIVVVVAAAVVVAVCCCCCWWCCPPTLVGVWESLRIFAYLENAHARNDTEIHSALQEWIVDSS